MANRRFWKGFLFGAAAGTGGMLAVLAAASAASGVRRGKILRIEKSLQIGLPVAEVFRSWTALQWIPAVSDLVQNVRVTGNRAHWTMRFGARPVEWDAEIEQLIPDQAIAWKSINGPKHTGRITFAPIGDNTLMQLTMNYYPRKTLRPFARQLAWPLELRAGRVLRDFKASLEGKGAREFRRPPHTETGSGPERATGTYGGPLDSPGDFL